MLLSKTRVKGQRSKVKGDSGFNCTSYFPLRTSHFVLFTSYFSIVNRQLSFPSSPYTLINAFTHPRFYTFTIPS
jgi:hypothetical protein